MIRVLSATIVIALAVLLAAAPTAAQDSAPERAMVSLRVTSQPTSPALPWNKKPEQTLPANAIVLPGRHLLTSADTIKDATLIEARAFARYPSYPAEAVLVDYELDLALLTVDDPAFWEKLEPLPFGRTPGRNGRFRINRWRPNGRFEQGGGEMVDFQIARSRFGAMEYPVLRGNTTMAGLGWAEMLTADGKIIGLITSHTEQEIEAVTGELLERFVKAAERTEYRGFVHRGFTWQALNQRDLRRAYGLRPDGAGVLVRRLFAEGTGHGSLRPGDILMELGDYTIDPEGQIDHPLYGPIRFTVALNETLQPHILAVVQRNDERKTLRLSRERFTRAAYRVHPYRFDRDIDYTVFGGLVVQELSSEFLHLWGRDWQDKAPARLTMAFTLDSLRHAGDEPEKVLIVSKVLPDPANLGYGDVEHAIITHANGRAVTSLQAFRDAIVHPEGDYHVIRTLPAQGRGKLVFRVDAMDETNRRIRERYSLPPSPETSQDAERASSQGDLAAIGITNAH